MSRAIALSRASRTPSTRRLAGEEIGFTDETRLAYERLAEPGSTRLTPQSDRRRREFLPRDGPLSAEAVALFARHLSGDREVNEGRARCDR